VSFSVGPEPTRTLIRLSRAWLGFQRRWSISGDPPISFVSRVVQPVIVVGADASDGANLNGVSFDAFNPAAGQRAHAALLAGPTSLIVHTYLFTTGAGSPFRIAVRPAPAAFALVADSNYLLATRAGTRAGFYSQAAAPVGVGSNVFGVVNPPPDRPIIVDPGQAFIIGVETADTFLAGALFFSEAA
jgi:hypothetical protein